MGRGKTVVLGLLMIHKLEMRILFFFFFLFNLDFQVFLQ